MNEPQRATGWWRLAPWFIALLASSGLLSGATVLEETTERTYNIDPRSSVQIQNTDGSIQIYGSNDNQLRIETIKRSYSAERLREIAVHVELRPGNIAITTQYPPPPHSLFSDRSGTVDYVIELPQTCNLASVELGAGEMLIRGMRGPNVQASLKNGRMFVRNCFTNTHLALANGGLEVAFDWWEDSGFSLEASVTGGDTRIFLPDDASFHVLAETGNGRVWTDFAEENSRPDNKKLDLTIGQTIGANIRLRTVNGNITVAERNP
jgi:DUF4097 and DUF4098 domain-containing protein YvlB